MFTDKRLTAAYTNAKVEYFDKDSRYVFLSDMHRGDDSVSDEFTRNQQIVCHALDYYYNNGYTYVEVGDGDELWEYSEFKHIRLAHKDIFIALRKLFADNRLIMIYGNHNIFLRDKNYMRKNYYRYYDEYNQELCDLFTSMKPEEALILKSKRTNQEILIVHGHQGDLMNDQLYLINLFFLRYFWRFMHVVGFQNPSSPARNQFKRHKIERTYKKWIQKHKKMLICGHTHRARFPKKHGLPYFNTGCCIHTRGITGLEIIGEKVLMVDWRVRANQNGVLEVVRTVVRGPIPIEKFDFRNYKFYKNTTSNPGFDETYI